MHRAGQYVRVIAIDSVTGTEVTMMGDSKQSIDTLKRLAARKLEYVLEKNKAAKKDKGIVV